METTKGHLSAADSEDDMPELPEELPPVMAPLSNQWKNAEPGQAVVIDRDGSSPRDILKPEDVCPPLAIEIAWAGE
jgi:hypothetical protein